MDSGLTERFQINLLGPVGNVDDSPTDGLVSHTLDIWINSSDQVVQTHNIMVLSPMDDSSETRAEALSVVSDVGEPNAITAPTVR